MYSEPHLPGYTVDDDDDPHDEHPTSEPEPESPNDAILVASSAGANDAIRAANTTTVPLSSQPVSTQRTPTPSSQQQAEEREDTTTTANANATTATTSTTSTPALPEQSALDDFADPKIASLHAIFPDYDAALL